MAANPKTLPTQEITITNETPNPDSPSIAKDGSIQFNSDANYTIEWQDEHGNKKTFWSPQPTTITQGLNEVQYATSSADHHTLTYTLGAAPMAAQGGGTVKVGT
jgi:hypothetical protein